MLWLFDCQKAFVHDVLTVKSVYDVVTVISYGIEFVQRGFFVRVIIQDRTEEGLNVAISFAHFISKRIK